MEVIQAPQGSPTPRPAPTAAWVDPLLLLLLTPVTPPLDLTPADASSPPPLVNCTWQNWTLPTDGGGHATAFLPVVAGVIIPFIYATVCVIGLVGNTLVIHVVLHHTRTQSVTNIYILNLAVADQLLMLGLPFLAVQNALLSWPFGPLACRLVTTVDAINQFTSIFCLTAMSVDRYLAVVHPVRAARWRRPCAARAVNGAAWAASFLVVLPVVAFAGVRRDDGTCGIVWPEPSAVWKASFIVYTTVVGFLGPLLVICLCYLLIVVKVRSAGKRVRAMSSRRRKSERKITRMVVVVVAVFVLCWLPFYVLNIVNLLVVLPGHLRGVYYFVVVLSYANSCANPILYGFLSDNFKRGFRKALCRSSRRVESQERACVQIQRPTEEWGGTALQPQNGLDVTDANKGGVEGQEEEEEMEGGNNATQMTEIRGTVRSSDNVAQGPESEPCPRGKSGEVGSGSVPGCPGQARSTLANKAKSGKTEESVDFSTISQLPVSAV